MTRRMNGSFFSRKVKPLGLAATDVIGSLLQAAGDELFSACIKPITLPTES